MPSVTAFRGILYDFRKISLSRAACPPYDVIPKTLARRLRRVPYNAVHLELPAGGEKSRYARAARTWAQWRRKGILNQDVRPAYYVLEQRFTLPGEKSERRRTGLLSALSLSSRAGVIPHEKTFSKPKQDRLKLLEALRVNTSPVFLLYADSGRIVRDCLRRATRVRGALLAAGRAADGVGIRLWRLDDPLLIQKIGDALGRKTFLVADGHHRLEVARQCGLESVLCCVCAEEDAGLAVLPTHRVVANGAEVRKHVLAACRCAPMPSLGALERALKRHPSPAAFGVVSARNRWLAAPKTTNAPGPRNLLAVEWLERNILPAADPRSIRYTHQAKEAAAWAGREGTAILIKPVSVREIRRAVGRAGLLPQKTTYFYPKVEAGLVFKEAE